MGYYTQFSVRVSPDLPEILEAMEEEDGTFYALDEGADSCKWYEHESDMCELSRRFPDALFELRGEGEESGDIWRKYFKNGRIQRCSAQITFDPFDESKLEEAV